MTQKADKLAKVSFRIAAIVVAIFLAVIIMRNTIVELGNDIRVPLGLSERIWPADGTLELIDQHLIVPQLDWAKNTPDAVILAARRARSLDPLDEWPFALIGMVQLKSRDYQSAARSLEQAHRRNARAPTPHLLLLLSYAQQPHKFDETIDEIVAFIHLKPQLSDPILPLLAAAVANQNNRRILNELDHSPDVLKLLIESVSRTPGEERILPLLLSRPSVTRKTKLASIEALAQRSRHDLAYSAWAKLDGKRLTIPYDRDFQGLEGPQPYAWTVTNSRDVNIDFARGNSNDEIALDVEAFGNTLSQVVYQIIPVSPGNHSLTILGNSVEPKAKSGKMRWELSCVKTNARLGQIEFPMINGLQKQSMAFIVPNKDCEFQMLSLFVVPSEDHSQYEMRFNRVELDMDS